VVVVEVELPPDKQVDVRVKPVGEGPGHLHLPAKPPPSAVVGEADGTAVTLSTRPS
jgi:hypothetical protein